MRRLMNLWSAAFAVIIFSALAAEATPTTAEWYNLGDTVGYGGGDWSISNHLGSALVGGADPTSGAFLQLIWVGANGTIDVAGDVGDGTTLGDDVVYAVAWLNVASPIPGGFYESTTIDDTTDAGRQFFVRAWELPSSSWDATVNSVVPVGPGAWYGDSQLITSTGANQQWNFETWTTSLQSVPEPSTLALCALAVGAVGFARRKRK